MAVRIAGTILPNNKRVVVGLTYIFGIGQNLAEKIVAEAGIDPNIRVKDIDETQANTLRTIVEKKHRVEGELKREISGNIKRLKEIKSYRGSRHSKNLPVRGQQTQTNSRTIRGNVRRTMGSGRKDSLQKT